MKISKTSKVNLTEHTGTTVNISGLLNLSIVYIVWGSTYLAIRIAVREGSGFPPFTMGAMRVLLAGFILISWSVLTKRKIKISKKELLILIISGNLLWLGGTGLVIFAEQRVESAFAALLIGSTPIWVAMVESFLDRKKPSLLLIISIIVGFIGVGLLSGPKLLSGVQADFFSVIALLVAPLSWSLGSIVQRRLKIKLTPVASSGYQHLFGGLGFLLVLMLAPEPIPNPAPEAWAAWAYLVIFGSIIAFTSYIKALHILPINISMTYAYVNPVIAVFLGWLILNEIITFQTIGGTFLIILGVAGVFQERLLSEKKLSSRP